MTIASNDNAATQPVTIDCTCSNVSGPCTCADCNCEPSGKGCGCAAANCDKCRCAADCNCEKCRCEDLDV